MLAYTYTYHTSYLYEYEPLSTQQNFTYFVDEWCKFPHEMTMMS